MAQANLNFWTTEFHLCAYKSSICIVCDTVNVHEKQQWGTEEKNPLGPKETPNKTINYSLKSGMQV